MAWLATLAAGGLSAAGASSAADKSSEAIAKAGKKNKKGYQAALSAIAPYQKVGGSALNSLAELMGFEGYRTPEEQAYTTYLATKPTYSGPGKVKPGEFERMMGLGPLGKTLDTQASLGGGPSVGGIGPKDIPGPLRDLMGAKDKRAEEDARRERKAKGAYVQQLASWEAKRAELENSSKNSLTNYDPNASLRNTPGYQSRYSEGLNTAQNSMAGSMLSGNALRGLTEYGQTFASNERDKEYNRLAGIAGMGQNASTATGNWAVGQGASGANLALMQGQNDENYYGNLNNILQGTLGNYLQYQQRAQPNTSLYGYDSYSRSLPTRTPSIPEGYTTYGTSYGE